MLIDDENGLLQHKQALQMLLIEGANVEAILKSVVKSTTLWEAIERLHPNQALP